MNDDMSIAYNSAFVRRAHQLLYWGYTRARKQFDKNTNEETISQYISMGIDKMLCTEDIPDEYERFSVGNEVVVSDTGLLGNNRKEIDILLFTTDPKTRPKFVFEAKRLKKGAFYISDYIGKEGIQCFINEEYAHQYPSAAMIGYMQSDYVDHWHKQLEAQFKGPALSALAIEKTLVLCNPCIIQDIPREWQSEHRRLTRPTLLIYHIFLDCS